MKYTTVQLFCFYFQHCSNIPEVHNCCEAVFLYFRYSSQLKLYTVSKVFSSMYLFSTECTYLHVFYWSTEVYSDSYLIFFSKEQWINVMAFNYSNPEKNTIQNALRQIVEQEDTESVVHVEG